jgi:hypothetical protein
VTAEPGSRVGEVLVEDLDGQLRIAPAKGVKDGEVLVGDMAPIAAGRDERDVGP